MRVFVLLSMVSLLTLSCSGFKAERVGSQESDEKALKITDQWLAKDTEEVVSKVLDAMKKHRGFRRYLAKKGGKRPSIFVGEVQNLTSEAYFPIQDINDELLNALSAKGDFILVDSSAREAILNEITYQQDGMVAKRSAKKVGKQTGADLIIFGNVYMRPATRKGKTIKQYSVNIRITDIESGEEVMRTRTKMSKYSERKRWGR